MMCTAAYPGRTYSASTANIPSGCRVILGFTDFEFMDGSVSGNIAISSLILSSNPMAKANLFAILPASCVVGVLTLTALPALQPARAQAQQTAPARKERGNLIYES